MIPAVETPAHRQPHPFVPLAGTTEGLRNITAAVTRAVGEAMTAHRPTGPLPPGTPADVLAAAAATLGPAELPAEGLGDEEALHRVATVLVEQGLDLAHPHAVAHLQPPPLATAVAADTLASAGNGSLDTFDSGPAGIAMERWVVGALTRLAGLGPTADGVLTPGGSLSNLMALLLARDTAAARLGIDVRRDGVAALPGPVVLCSELAHFSVHRACAALGLGEAAVLTVPVDGRHRMRADALAAILSGLGQDRTPVAVVATAGTTDFGSVDPLADIAALSGPLGIWLHVDAAYGFGALFSERLAHKVDGLHLADSITVDLHKLGWQPASASALLVSVATAFSALDRSVAYLNPADDSAAGYDGLLGRTLQTTRRPDAVKMAATLLAHGRAGLGQLVDRCHELAGYVQRAVAKNSRLELVAPVELTTVVFRYRTHDPELSDQVNRELRRRLLRSGRAVVGRTEVRLRGLGAAASTCLKFTLLNPNSTAADLDTLIAAVVDAGAASEDRFTLEEGAA